MHDDSGDHRIALHRIVYDSVVLLPFGEEGERGMQGIVAAARLRNALLGVTGALYCDGAYFMQVLEGPREAVETVFASIARDARHGDLRIVDRGPIQARSFGHWHMAWVSEADMGKALARHPDMPEVRPYRAPELITALRRAMEDEGG